MRARPAPVAAIAAILACLLAAGTASAAGQRDRQAAAKERIDGISAALAESRGTLADARAEAERSAAREAEYSGLIGTGRERSLQLGGRVATAKRRLDRSRKRLRSAREQLERRLASIYMSGLPDTVDLALGSGSFSGLTSATVYLRSITEADTELAERVADLEVALDGRVAELGAAKAAVDAHNADLERARAGIAAAKAAAESTDGRLAAVNRTRRSEIASLRADIDTWQRQIEREKAREAEPAASAAGAAREEVARQLGGPYSIPTYIVMCESGGNYSALNPSSGAGGAYQIMPSTWEAYGGKGLPHQASKAEQDRIASLIWADSGPGAWSCA